MSDRLSVSFMIAMAPAASLSPARSDISSVDDPGRLNTQRLFEETKV
jgi:hypothetical protein